MKNIRKFETTADMENAVLAEPYVLYNEETGLVKTNPNGGSSDNEVNYSTEYLTFEAIEDSTFNLTRTACEYSLDEGYTWVSLSAYNDTPTVSAGSKIMFKHANPSISNSYGIGTFSSTGKFNIEGNIMSMLYSDNFIDKTDLTGKDCVFAKLFHECTNVVEAHNLILPATTLADYCYVNMFSGCTSLTTAPKLPATTLTKSCYNAMFYGCSSLTTAPELPATTLGDYCYSYMFMGCTSLVTAPALPATILSERCYFQMFYGCSSLTTVHSILPATILSERCYYYMFCDCTSLVNAPELPATTLAPSCYYYMFYGCTNLKHITMLATDISASECLWRWVGGVSSTGTFVKHPDMTSLPTGTSGIPNGWTVEDAVL